MYRLETEALSREKSLLKQEFLLTNGLGGYASSTVNQVHTRKYHGLLVAAIAPPVKRWMTVSAMSETITLENRAFHLNTMALEGPLKTTDKCESVCLEAFDLSYRAQWTYSLPKGTLTKTLTLMPYDNVALVTYDMTLDAAFELRLSPWASLRDHHEVQGLNPETQAQVSADWEDHRLKIGRQMEGAEAVAVYVQCPMAFEAEARFSDPVPLDNEVERGLEPEDVLWCPGSFVQAFEAGSHRIDCVISLEAAMPTPETIEAAAKAHYDALMEASRTLTDDQPKEVRKLHEQLSFAASQFLVKRASTGRHTVMAGYPWFTDWGRDTMIALPGLTVGAGRPDLFKEIMETFIHYMKDGILPNVFPDQGEDPLYNTVDATLWMPVALKRYYDATRDFDFIDRVGLPALLEMIDCYSAGTLNQTYMDADGLIHSGSPETQLTWMDVKVKGWVVTPRHGKAVEINGLWYNALCITKAFLEHRFKLNQGYTLEEAERAAAIGGLADKVKESFRKTFLVDAQAHLIDCVREDEVLSLHRPNGIIALSLPYDLLTQAEMQRVLEAANQDLLTPFGLRSQAVDAPDYQGIYQGDVLARDGAYHRGTVWAWLLGPYLEVVYKVKGRTPAVHREVFEQLQALCHHLEDTALGQLSEIFDGDSPHAPRGCMAQAWSVAEALRLLNQVHL